MTDAPGAVPFLGHLPAYHRDKLGFLDSCRTAGAPVVRLRFARPTYLLLAPEDIRHVLVVAHRTYAKTRRITGERGQRAVGAGVLAAPEDVHRSQRRAVQPLFRAQALARFGETVVQHADRVLDRWRDGHVTDVSLDMVEIAEGVMLEAILGVRSSDDRAALLAGVVARRRSLERTVRLPPALPSGLPLGLRPRRARSLRELDRALLRPVDGGAEVPSLLAELWSVRTADGELLPPAAVRDEALSLAVAGFETIGQGMGWCLLGLAETPEAARRLRAEVDGLDGEPPRVADLARLPFTEAALYEAMRVRPPGWILGREALRDDDLPSGARLPAGARVLVSQWVTHRDPALYPDPERFDPGRFLGDAPDGRPKLSYFPFGGGPRECVGRRLAMLEGVLVLARVAQRARLEPAPGPVRVKPGMALRPAGGLPMRIRLVARPPVPVAVSS